ncbi:CPBP family intramembrane metalloprotease [Solibacillus sp. MA9]|uniref:CPBP family intramembrane metalloprotease n=1 Tax=Solibacillus palustris TaxID=2908203 RepID=A0ABS9UFR5_9BACL|nr:CPBP family intramembrane glutamic endopeptidase [Solibacillus sp. MA9]MCH7322765.1 CPBP family intramembrane metalloprotease [Solibacillus sp. MA9]
MIINLLISAIFQVLLFSIIPFVWWLVTARKETRLLTWLGIKKIKIRNYQTYMASFLLVMIILVIPAYIAVILFMDDSAMATSQFSGKGLSAFIPALIYAFLQTGLSEEIFFRGFLTKRLIFKFGFQLGNSIQGFLFGLMHGAIFMMLLNPIQLIIIILITGVGGYLLGWINEKQSNGSIISSWLIHGIVNTISSTWALFNLM